MVREQRNDAAVSMIVGLSDFLRRVLEDSTLQQVPLEEEMEFAHKYLEIQKVRFAERLQLSVDVPRELYSAQVPSLILQPMVENAVKHGIAKRAQGGEIRIAASRSNGILTLSVYNDGPGLPAGVGDDSFWNWYLQYANPPAKSIWRRLRVEYAESKLKRCDGVGFLALRGCPALQGGLIRVRGRTSE